MLSADLTHLPTRPGDWGVLLDAIYNADDTDERDELEWKSTLDLASKAGVFHIARFILAAANRDPGDLSSFDGHAVMIVGLAPGSIQGVQRVDVADLSPRLRTYVGDAIGFEPRYFSYKETDVLVVTVSPPRHGDPLYPLRKTADGGNHGTVYRRHDTKSQPATPAGIDALSRRAATTTRRIDLEVAANLTSPIRGFTWDGTLAAQWIERERNRLNDARSNPRRMAPQFLTSISVLGLTEEDRSPGDYATEIAEYTRELQRSFETAARQYVANRAARISITAKNPTDRNLEDVEVAVYIPGTVETYEQTGDEMRELLPAPPRAWGPRENTLGSMIHSPLPSFDAMFPSVMTSQNGGSTHVNIAVGHLRPHETFVMEPDDALAVLSVSELVEETVRATWTATASNQDGRASGKLLLEAVPGVRDVTREIWTNLTAGTA